MDKNEMDTIKPFLMFLNSSFVISPLAYQFGMRLGHHYTGSQEGFLIHTRLLMDGKIPLS